MILPKTNKTPIIRPLNLMVLLGLLCLVALVLVPVQTARAKQGFQLKVNLYDSKSDSGKVKVYVLSEGTDKKKSKTIDVGRITGKTGDSNIERLMFRFSEKELPPNGAFSACVYSNSYGKTQCEQADRHYTANSAVMWVQVPG